MRIYRWRAFICFILLFNISLKAQNYSYIYPSQRDSLRILILGDIMLHKEQIERDYTKSFDCVKELLQNQDFCIANMEFSLGGKPYRGYPSFSSPDEYAYAINDAGVNVFLAANNHIMDREEYGLKRTIKIYRKMGVPFTGISMDPKEEAQNYPLILYKKDYKIALLNFTYGTNHEYNKDYPKVNKIDSLDISKAIDRAKMANVDYIIVLPHWGIEYKLQHSPNQEKLSKWLIANGVDMIVGSHPHVLQDRQEINGKKVYYSLGNVISNMSAINTQVGLALQLVFVKNDKDEFVCEVEKPIFLWSSRSGGFNEYFTVLEIEKYIDKKDLWQNPKDYDKMLQSYQRLKGILNY